MHPLSPQQEVDGDEEERRERHVIECGGRLKHDDGQRREEHGAERGCSPVEAQCAGDAGHRQHRRQQRDELEERREALIPGERHRPRGDQLGAGCEDVQPQVVRPLDIADGVLLAPESGAGEVVPERVVVVRRRGDRQHDRVRRDRRRRRRPGSPPPDPAAPRRSHARPARRAARDGSTRQDQTGPRAPASMAEPMSSQPRVSPSNGDSTSIEHDDGAVRRRERARAGNRPRLATRATRQPATPWRRSSAKPRINAAVPRRRLSPIVTGGRGTIGGAFRPDARTPHRRHPNLGRRRLLRHRRDRPQPPGLGGAGAAALPRRVSCGVNAVKLQKRDNRSLYTRAAYDAPYEHENSFGATYGEHREALEFDASEYRELQACARELGLAFSPRPLTMPSADLLAELDMPAYKIASGDLRNTPLLRHVASLGKPMIVSTGGATIEDVDRAVEAIRPSTRRSACSSARLPIRPRSRSSSWA